MRTPLLRLLRTVLAALGALTLVVSGATVAGASPVQENGGSSQTTSTETISAKAINDHECDSTEWHFVITQVTPENAPEAITVDLRHSGT